MIKIGEPFVELATIDSTNIYAMQQTHARLSTPGTVYFAWEQTAGKGQRQRHWHAEPGKNLTMSAVIAAPYPDPSKQFLLSCATALACCEFFEKYAGDETAIKWPNDLYWNDRKAGGILIENIIRGGIWEWAIIGTGININQVKFPAEAKKAVSLLQITGRNFNILSMAKELCSCLTRRLAVKIPEPDLLKEYNSRLFKLDKKIALKTQEGRVDGILKGVDISGNLLVSGPEDYCFSFGSVEWITD